MSDEPEFPTAPSDAEASPDPSETDVPPPPPENPPSAPSPPEDVTVPPEGTPAPLEPTAPPEGEGDAPPPDTSKASVAENPESLTINRSSLSQSTRSYMFLDSVDASVLYEKDGSWVLEKIPDDVKGQIENVDDDDSSKCMEGAGPREPHIVSIDAVTGNDTIPCNLCDQGQCLPESELAPAWLWMYDVTTQMITLANEYKRNMLQSDVSCGEATNGNSSIDDRLVASKGTQHTTFAEGDESTAPPEDDPQPPPEPPADLAPDTDNEGAQDEPADSNGEPPADNPPEAPEDVPPEAPEDIPPEAPEDVPPEAPEDIPPEAPEDVPPEAPEDSSAEVPAEAKAVVEAPVELPSEEPAEPPKDASAEVIPVSSEKQLDDPPEVAV